MNWYDMQCFVVLARTGSISKAAAELQQDRGAVARRVSDLQNALGSRLYVGNSKNFRLTPPGEMLLRELVPTEDAVQRVLAGVLPLKGLVTLTAAPITAIRAIAPTLPDLRRRHPELRIILKSFPDRALLERGEADIAMGTKKPHSDAAIVHEVGVLEYDVYRSARLEIGPDDQWTYIAADRDYDHLPCQEWLIQEAGERECVFQTHDVIVQMEAVAAGLGVAVLPCLVADEDRRIKRLGWPNRPPNRTMYVSSYQAFEEGSTLQQVMDHCERVIADELSRCHPEE